MLPIFKTLASITIWVLFISGLGGVAVGAFYGIFTGDPVGLLIWVIGIVSLFLSLIAARLRKKLE